MLTICNCVLPPASGSKLPLALLLPGSKVVGVVIVPTEQHGAVHLHVDWTHPGSSCVAPGANVVGSSTAA